VSSAEVEEETEVRKPYSYILEDDRAIDGQIEKKQELKGALKWRGRDGMIERLKDKEEER